MTVAFQTAQYLVSSSNKSLLDFGFTVQELERMEVATVGTRGDILITYDGLNNPVITPEFGIYLASGTIFTLKGNENLLHLEMIRAGTTDSLVTVCLEYGEYESFIK